MKLPDSTRSPREFGDWLGLSCEQRLVDFQVLSSEQYAINRHLIAGPEFQHVVYDDLIYRYILDDGITHDVSFGRDQQP